MNLNCILIFILFYATFIGASIEKRVIQIETKTRQFQKILEKSEKEMTKNLISEILGEENYQTFHKKIEKKIFPERKKFILLTKILNTEKIDQEKSVEKKQAHFLTKVLVHFSKETLKKILIQENLFYLDQGANKILTLIEFKDSERGKIYRWWSKERKDPPFTQFEFYNDLQSIFILQGFYLIHPEVSQSQAMLIPNIQYNSINANTGRDIARFFDSQLFILGSITLSSLSETMNQVVWDLALYHSIHLRKLAYHKTRVKIPKNSWKFLKQHTDYWAKNFALQLNSIYEKGVLSTQLFKIEIFGKLSFLERKFIKQTLVDKIENIKNLQEKLISADRAQYIANVDKDDKALLNKIKKIKLLDFDFSPYIQSKNHIVIRVKKNKG